VVVQAPLTARPVGFVVAGGLSTRMGRDKALLPWDGSTLLDHAIARLAAVCADVRILCGPAPRYEDRGRPVVVDAVPDHGPLGGLAAGLASAGDAPGLFLGVDLPHVTVPLLSALASLGEWPRPGADSVRPGADGARPGADGPRPGADTNGDADAPADAVVPVTAAGPEPLCALYHPRCLPAVRARLAAGDLRMTSFWPEVRVRRLEGAALAAFGDPRRIFHNLNAPADYPEGAGEA
jgi:molybdopterin-guanine dinucleotide biosynthesis protein A